jgi:hypothetical protein
LPETPNALWVEAMAECMGHHVIRHHTKKPGVGKTAQALIATRRLEDSLHEPMVTIFPCLIQDDRTCQFNMAPLSDGTC